MKKKEYTTKNNEKILKLYYHYHTTHGWRNNSRRSICRWQTNKRTDEQEETIENKNKNE